MAITTPTAFWNLDESSGNASDAVSGGANNTLVNGNTTPYVAAKINNGAQTASASSRGFLITNANQTNLVVPANTSFSLSLFYKPDTLADNQLMGMYGSGGNRAWRFEQNSDGGSTFYLTVTNDGSTGFQGSWAGGLSTGVWYHIVLTWKQSTSKANLYINSTAQTEATTGAVTSLFNSTSDFSVGKDAVTGNYSNATFDMVGFWNGTVLTQTEVNELYNAGAGVQYPFGGAAAVVPVSNLLTLGAG
jgi:hypothetical protein